MGTKYQKTVYEWVNISDELLYEWVRFFKGQVYERIVARIPIPQLSKTRYANVAMGEAYRLKEASAIIVISYTRLNVRKRNSDMCAQRRLKSAARPRNQISLRCSHNETLQSSLSTIRQVKMQIRLRKYTG